MLQWLEDAGVRILPNFKIIVLINLEIPNSSVSVREYINSTCSSVGLMSDRKEVEMAVKRT
jgi:hypothetical protein